MSTTCRWRLKHSVYPEPFQWDLVVTTKIGRKTKEIVVAQVWSNGTWHTFDENGVGVRGY